MGWEVLLEAFWNRKQLSDSGVCLCDHTHQSSQHGYMNWVWPLCYRTGCTITKYHRLVALTTEICFLTTLEAGSLRPNVDRVDVCWELLLGAPFQCVLTRSFLGDSAGGKSEGDGGRGRKSDLLVSLFFFFAAAAAKSLQLCPTLGDPIDGSPPGSPVPEILQVKTLGGLPFPSPLLFFLPKFKSSWLYDHRNTINIHSWWTLL